MPSRRTNARSFRTAMHMFGLAVSAPAQAAIGGQAVVEGVMMRAPNHWGVAIRRGNREIVDVTRAKASYASTHTWARIPFLRGIAALGESLSIGMRALNVSAYYAAEWEEEEAARAAAIDGVDHEAPRASGVTLDGSVSTVSIDARDAGIDTVVAIEDGAATATHAHLADPDDVGSAASPESLSWWQLALTMAFAFGFAIALFKLLPLFLTDRAFGGHDHSLSFVVVEGGIRVGVFCLYLTLVGLAPSMKRVFQYHSAEHKAINAWEHGISLEPELVNRQSRIHVRCGTAFMLWVLVVAILVFGLFGYWFNPSRSELVLSRVLFLPLIAGISFEIIRFAGRHADNAVVRGILAPGLWLQRLTTRECEPEHCEVAIRSLTAVLDLEYPGRTTGEALAGLTEGDAFRVLA